MLKSLRSIFAKQIQALLTVYGLQSTVICFAVVGRRWSVDKHGFTLVEIMVAISILAIIGAVSIPNLRLFNENQILQNTTNDLVRILRDAQSAGNSHIQCTYPLRAKEWSVSIASANYQLEARCYDPSSSAPPPGPEARYSPAPAVVSGVAFHVRTPGTVCDSPRRIAFGAEYQPYLPDRFSNISYNCANTPPVSPRVDNKLEVQLTRNSVNQYVCIDKGGSINASQSPCF